MTEYLVDVLIILALDSKRCDHEFSDDNKELLFSIEELDNKLETLSWATEPDTSKIREIEREMAHLQSVLFQCFRHPFTQAIEWCTRRTGRASKDIEIAAMHGFDAGHLSNEPAVRSELPALVHALQALKDWKTTAWGKWFFEYGMTDLTATTPSWFVQPEVENKENQKFGSRDSQTDQIDEGDRSATRKEENRTDTAEDQLPKDDDPPSEPKLSELQCRCLETLRRLKATERRPIPQRELAPTIQAGADANYIKTPMGDLSRMGYVGGKRGRKGGNWITKNGRTRLAAEKKAGWRWE
jgi:hypothetical protein